MSDLYRHLLEELTTKFGGNLDDANADAIAYAAAELYHRDFEPHLWEEKSAHEVLDLFGVPRAGMFSPYSLSERLIVFQRRSSRTEYVNRAHDVLTALGVPRQDEAGDVYSLKTRLDLFLSGSGGTMGEELPESEPSAGANGEVTADEPAPDVSVADEGNGRAQAEDGEHDGETGEAQAEEEVDGAVADGPAADGPAVVDADTGLAPVVDADTGLAPLTTEPDTGLAPVDDAEPDTGVAPVDDAEPDTGLAPVDDAEPEGEDGPQAEDEEEEATADAAAPDGPTAEAVASSEDEAGGDDGSEARAAVPVLTELPVPGVVEEELPEEDLTVGNGQRDGEPLTTEELKPDAATTQTAGLDVDEAPGAAPLVDAVRALEHAARVEAELAEVGPEGPGGVDLIRLSDNLNGLQAEVAALRTLIESLGNELRERLEAIHEEVLTATGVLQPNAGAAAPAPAAPSPADQITRVLPPVEPEAEPAEAPAETAPAPRRKRRVLLFVILFLLGLVLAGVIVLIAIYGWDRIESEVTGVLTAPAVGAAALSIAARSRGAVS